MNYDDLTELQQYLKKLSLGDGDNNLNTQKYFTIPNNINEKDEKDDIIHQPKCFHCNYLPQKCDLHSPNLYIMCCLGFRSNTINIISASHDTSIITVCTLVCASIHQLYNFFTRTGVPPTVLQMSLSFKKKNLHELEHLHAWASYFDQQHDTQRKRKHSKQMLDMVESLGAKQSSIDMTHRDMTRYKNISVVQTLSPYDTDAHITIDTQLSSFNNTISFYITFMETFYKLTNRTYTHGHRKNVWYLFINFNSFGTPYSLTLSTPQSNVDPAAPTPLLS